MADYLTTNRQIVTTILRFVVKWSGWFWGRFEGREAGIYDLWQGMQTVRSMVARGLGRRDSRVSGLTI
jgi:hypothetical protein